MRERERQQQHVHEMGFATVNGAVAVAKCGRNERTMFFVGAMFYI